MLAKIAVLVSVLAVTQANWLNGAMNKDQATPYTAACITGNFRPSNGDYMPQSTASPFKVIVRAAKDGRYYPGDPVIVKIRSINPNTLFESYHIRGDCSKPVFSGNFTCEGGKESNYCNEDKNPNRKVDAITNVNNTLKSEVKCIWTPPNHSIGNVQFSATVVESHEKFWTGVLSKVIKPSLSVISYEAHQDQIVKAKMAEFQKLSQNAMRQYKQMMAGMAGQSGGSPFSSLFGGAQKTNQNQQANPAMQMMSGFLQNQRQGRGMGQQQSWGNRFNMGESQGGEANENPMFGGAW